MATHVFDDFSGGWYGTLDPAKAPRNMFDARNMLLYRDGSLGPRPGLQAFNIGRTTAGKIHGFMYNGADTRPLVYVDGVKVWGVSDDNAGSFSRDMGLAPGSGDLSAAPTNDRPIHMYIPVGGSKTGVMNVHGVGAFWLFDDSVAYLNTTSGMTGTVYGRVVRSDITQPNRLFYCTSALDGGISVGTWPAINFLDISGVGYTDIVHVTNQKNHMSICFEDGTWFVVTGALGITDTLRQITPGMVLNTPIAVDSFVSTLDTMIHYLSPLNNFPATFDGTEQVDIPYLSMTPEDAQSSYASAGKEAAHAAVKGILGLNANSPGFILRAPTNRMLLKHNGAWALHNFGIDVGKSWASDQNGRLYGFGPIQAGANTPVFSTDLRLNRPAFTTDIYAQPGDLSNTPVAAEMTLSETWSETSDKVTVSEVVLDIKRWNTGASEDNRIICEVTALSRGSQVTDRTQTQTWTQPGASSTAAGVNDHIRFAFGEQGAGAGFRVRLSGIRGIAVRRAVVTDTEALGDSRPW